MVFMAKSCFKGVLVPKWWGERGCDCQGLQGLLWLMVVLVQLQSELEGWEEGGEISVPRQGGLIGECRVTVTIP